MAKRKFYREIFKKDSWGRRLLKILGFCFLAGFAMVFFVFVSYVKDLPRPEKFTEKETAQSTKIYARDGETLLYEIYGEEKRTIVPLDQISDYLKNALLASEDSDFYNHHGISFRGIARAILTDLRLLAFSQGASTISQQLVRSSYLSLEKTGERKTKEIILTLELERRYSKDEIFEFYLNQIPFGQNTYGAQAASQTYFQKDAKDISLAEAALLT
ncbi:penicillin-binding protein, partial [Candidatus Parcubacteria bacterium]|nr:penicillin-binding protein [Patescibacteria group bacterium]MCG2688108.1 penicillin-binding protein [Candidatus Parcubacteria bacterium]